ncbi:MAG TPA: DMT family transporter [Myxococcales bacterium]|nr:DMT family transporter [Myxococcales bacterium]
MADLALTLIMAVWGSSFAILRSLLGNAAASPLSLVAVRMALASALLLGGMAATRSGRTQLRGLRGELLRDGLVAGGLLGLGFLLQTEGLQRTTASRSGFLTGTLVVFTPLIEFVLFRKRPAPPALAGVLLAFVGITVLSAPWSGAARPTALGDALTLGCAVVFAGQIVALGRIARKHPVLPLLLVQLATTGAVAAIAGPLVETQHFSGAPRLWLALLYLAVFATLLAFGVQTWAQRILPSVRVALISSLEPVFAAIWAAILIGERLSLRELVGGAMIVLGVAVGEAGAALRARARGPAEPV